MNCFLINIGWDVVRNFIDGFICFWGGRSIVLNLLDVIKLVFCDEILIEKDGKWRKEIYKCLLKLSKFLLKIVVVICM